MLDIDPCFWQPTITVNDVVSLMKALESPMASFLIQLPPSLLHLQPPHNPNHSMQDSPHHSLYSHFHPDKHIIFCLLFPSVLTDIQPVSLDSEYPATWHGVQLL